MDNTDRSTSSKPLLLETDRRLITSAGLRELFYDSVVRAYFHIHGVEEFVNQISKDFCVSKSLAKILQALFKLLIIQTVPVVVFNSTKTRKDAILEIINDFPEYELVVMNSVNDKTMRIGRIRYFITHTKNILPNCDPQVILRKSRNKNQKVC